MWSTPAVWKQYNKMAVLHFFLVNSSLYIYSILYGKYACPKLKLSRLLLDNLFRILVRNCAKLEFRKSGIVQFCAKWHLRMIAQIVVFFAQRKKNFAFRSAKVLRMETLFLGFWIPPEEFGYSSWGFKFHRKGFRYPPYKGFKIPLEVAYRGLKFLRRDLDILPGGLKI